MRALCLDIGSARVGVAISDPSGAVASPVAVLDARKLASDLAPLLHLAEDYEIEILVAGLPLTLAGEEGPQAVETRSTAARFAEALGIPLEFQDERNSTAEARRSMQAAGWSEKEQRGSLDKVAAAIVLQTWLDERRKASRR